MAAGRGTLVGRDAELSELDRVLAEACGGTARAVFVSGEPGIGKTFVLAELARRAEARHCLVLEGSAAEFEQELPFGVVIDALDDYVQSLGRPVVERLAADGLTELAGVFPSLRSLRLTSDRPASAAERFQTYYAVRELLERLAARQPLVLILDDLHWADGASLELVAHLLRRPPDAPVLMAATFRPGQSDPALVAAVEGATRSGGAASLPLGPLTAEDAARLVGPDDLLYRQSGGNPFYLLQLARSGSPAVLTSRVADADADGVAPPAVAAAIAAELAALAPPARAFAEAAAVVGDPFELELSAAAAAVSEPDALTALDALVARDLVRPASVPRRFAFRHPLVRSAVYQGASVGTRLGAHARCAQALATRGAPATVRAHHVEQSARHGDPAAVAVLLEAGRANAQHLPSSAVRWFGAALRLLPDGAPADQRVDVLVELADALGLAGRLPEARDVLVEAIALAAPADERRLKLIAGCASVEQQLGMLAESHSRLLAALDEVTVRNSQPGVALMVALAIDGFYQMKYQAMEDWGASAVAAASELGDRALSGAAAAILAFGCAFTGSTDRAEANLRTATEIIDGMTDDQLSGRVEAVAHVAAAELYLERFEETARHSQRGVDLARSLGQIHVYPTLFPCLGTSLWVLGHLPESAAVLDGGIEAARLTGNGQSIAWSLLNRSLGAIVAGDLDLAVALSEESVGLVDDSFIAALTGEVLGWALLESGDPARGAETMVKAGGGETLTNIPGGWRATYLEVLVRCWLALDRVDDARNAAREARAVADQVCLPRTEAMARLATAAVALYEGDAPVAVDDARAAVMAAEKASAWYDVARARTVLGRALALAGDTGAAIAELEQAAADFDRFGAPRWRDRAEQELRRLGHRVHRRSSPASSDGTGLNALSGRELEVARLVVNRRTNPEIAADLFLSLKTVETHMRNIFRKLDVSSRVDVARSLERASR